MLNYIIKRLFLIIPTLFGILAVNFIIIQAAPGGPVEKAIAQIKGTEVSVTERFTSSGGEQLSNKQSQKNFNTQESKYRGSQGIDPPVYVNWTKDGVLLNKTNTLVIRQVTFEDKGYYECTAENDYGKANSSFWIDVTGKLYILVYVIYQTCNLTKRLFLSLSQI